MSPTNYRQHLRPHATNDGPALFPGHRMTTTATSHHSPRLPLGLIHQRRAHLYLRNRTHPNRLCRVPSIEQNEEWKSPHRIRRPPSSVSIAPSTQPNLNIRINDHAACVIKQQFPNPQNFVPSNLKTSYPSFSIPFRVCLAACLETMRQSITRFILCGR